MPDDPTTGTPGRQDPPTPGFEVLSQEQCYALLRTARIGRVAVTMAAIPTITPVNYQFVDDAIFFRTGEGAKLAAATHHAVVAFEIDDIDPVYHAGWSVVAVGTTSHVERPGAELGARLSLRAWAPGVREHLVRIEPRIVTGRRIAAGHDESPWP